MSPTPNIESASGLRLESASGLRPASAFFVIVTVLSLAAVWVGRAALGAEVPERRWEQIEKDPPPAYTIVDREERAMALFVQRLDLVMSPNATWQAHTPLTIAEGIAEVLGLGVEPAALLERMLPDATRGVIVTDMPLDALQAGRIERWIQTGSPEGDGEDQPIANMWIAIDGGNLFLCWRPALVLDESERSRHELKFHGNPLKWARHIADGLALSLMGEDALQIGDDELELEDQRAQIWGWLCPNTSCVAVRGFDAAKAPALLDFLNQEHVAYHQMRIERGRDRRYPSGRFEVLGGWNFVDRDDALARSALALEEAGSSGAPSATANAALADNVVADVRDRARATWELLAQPLPVSGIERACDQLLGDRTRWSFLEEQQATYAFRRNRSVRGKVSRSYYLESLEASESPRVVTTFDLMLQRQVGLALDDLMAEHRPALAMAIAIELSSGNVLALDSRASYEISGFAPLYHEFTPGSTFKVPVMACALESGAVVPSDRFDVGNRSYRLGKRTIHEAESSKTGVLSAAECLAHSVNAGLAQIGVLVPDTFLRERFTALHYGAAPHSGLGGERDGYLPTLPWKHDWTHASISFGHELKVTLWQHAAGLAAVCRGGQWLPLRYLDSIEQEGERFELPHAQPEPVFSAQTCEQVREMMMLGAREGTGKPVASPEKVPGLVVGTKTGTAEKVRTEVCVHLELADQAAHHRRGTRCSPACRRALVGAARDHRVCYTSSMCIWGRSEDSEREVMVLVVADEPRGREKYGSRVAGPTAVRILREALGATRNGQPVVRDIEPGFAPSQAASAPSADRPWEEARW